MVAAKRIAVATSKFDKNVTKRGNATNKATAKDEGGFSAAPWLIGLFVFVVVGSAFVQVFRNVQVGYVDE